MKRVRWGIGVDLKDRNRTLTDASEETVIAEETEAKPIAEAVTWYVPAVLITTGENVAFVASPGESVKEKDCPDAVPVVPVKDNIIIDSVVGGGTAASRVGTNVAGV